MAWGVTVLVETMLMWSQVKDCCSEHQALKRHRQSFKVRPDKRPPGAALAPCLGQGLEAGIPQKRGLPALCFSAPGTSRTSPPRSDTHSQKA